MADTELNEMSLSLQDAFFRKEDEKLIENLRMMRKLSESKEALRNVSGITDEHLLARLVELEVRPETLASFALVPLIEVAWADGKVSALDSAAWITRSLRSGRPFVPMRFSLQHGNILPVISAKTSRPKTRLFLKRIFLTMQPPSQRPAAVFLAWERFRAKRRRSLNASTVRLSDS